MRERKEGADLIAEQRGLLKKVYGEGEGEWKVVILDDFNRQVNSLHFKMKDLRESNVTLYFHLREAREQLHGVTAIYLVQPTPDNIAAIEEDFIEDLYSSVVVHFSSEPPAHLLADFASRLGKLGNALTKIRKVEYSCLGFRTVSRNLAVMEGNNEIINLLCTLGRNSIFVYGAREKEQVEFIQERLASHPVLARDSQLVSSRQPQNIVLFFNREQDYFPVLHHSVSYAGLLESIHKLAPAGSRFTNDRKETVLEVELTDDIWTDRRNLPVSEMQLSEEFSRLKARLSGERERLDEVNEVTERCKRVESHIHIAEELIKQASSRKLMQYNECEMEIYRKRVLSSELQKDVEVLLATTDHSPDKVRLITIILLYCEHLNPKELEAFEAQVPALASNAFYQEAKKKLTSKDSGESGIIGGKMLKKFTFSLLSNFKSGEKFLLTKCVEKARELREGELREMGLSVRGLDPRGGEVKVGNIVVYCVGGGCLSEEANLSKYDPQAIYTADRMLHHSDLI